MRAILNHTQEQAEELLARLNTNLGSVYLPEESVIKRYIYWYVPIIEGYEYLFSDNTLDREVDIDVGVFKITGNPNVNTSFNIGIDILSKDIDISNNNLDVNVVDTEINSLITNFTNFNGNEYVSLDIGGDENFPLYANDTPSSEVVLAADTFAKNNNVQINYWDGSKNVSLPSAQVSITTNNDYAIESVDIIKKGRIDFKDVPEEENTFFIRKAVFEKFATLMNGERYAESQFKCCVLFNDSLTVQNVFVKPESGVFELEGLNLAYAPFDFFMKAIVLPDLGDPAMDVWNSFIKNNVIEKEKIFRVFPSIDLTLIQ